MTVRGRSTVVVVAAEDDERLAARIPSLPFLQFMESLELDALDMTQDADAGRDVDL